MGEISKKRGEFGEQIVSELLKLIGWETTLSGRDIECFRPQEHSISTKERRDHGVDFVYRYDCPLYSNREVFALVSSKINDSYPSNPVPKFKAHIRDIAFALECFSRSNLRSKLRKPQTIISHKTSGVIFWIDNKSDYDDIIERLTDFRIDDDLSFDTIYLIDNKRADFLFDTIAFAKSKFKTSDVEFVHPATGYNATAKQRLSSSAILPVQYLNSSVLPLRITIDDDDFLLLNCIDDFEEDYLRKLISLSQKLTESWVSKVYILFPTFNENLHQEKVDDVKIEFRDRRFVNKITVSSFRPDFRNVELR